MDLASAVAKYLEAAGEFGRRAHLSALGLSKEETVRVVSAWDEDYQISRYLQLTREPDAALAAYPAEGRVFRINGFECSHFAFDARIREVLG